MAYSTVKSHSNLIITNNLFYKQTAITQEKNKPANFLNWFNKKTKTLVPLGDSTEQQFKHCKFVDLQVIYPPAPSPINTELYV